MFADGYKTVRLLARRPHGGVLLKAAAAGGRHTALRNDRASAA